jgi:hypothetical protein
MSSWLPIARRLQRGAAVAPLLLTTGLGVVSHLALVLGHAAWGPPLKDRR